jgi:hypothetical protein
VILRQPFLSVGYKKHGVLQFGISAHEVLRFPRGSAQPSQRLSFLHIQKHSQFQTASFAASC